MEDWINIHTHKAGKGINVVDPCLGEIGGAAESIVYYSMGIHPMYIDETAEERLREIEEAAVGRNIVAVGEAGLDRNSLTPMEVQMMWLEQQAEIAAQNDLPLIIHGVRAIPELIAVYNRCRSHQNWIMHGFNNRLEILQDLLKHDFYISAGRHVMNEGANVFQLLPEIPIERLFLETDNSDYGIDEIYRKVAERRGMPLEELQSKVRQNFNKVFHL